MEKVRYMISDAAGLVNVEAHVLRYWEEELELDIPRNELGHRYYTKENIEQFFGRAHSAQKSRYSQHSDRICFFLSIFWMSLFYASNFFRDSRISCTVAAIPG